MTARRRDLVLLGLVLLVAVALRVVGLEGRGQWDDDQGAHLLAVRAWVVDGVVPLVGPTSSIGEAHHGALYYWLLAPGAALTGTSPLAAVVTLLLVGLLGVAATWLLARTVGGPVAAVAAGLLAAVSPVSIEASTFIWNPNLVAPGTALAAAGAWHAWVARDARGWVVTAAGLTLAVQGHLLAAVIVPPFLVLLALDARRGGARGGRAIGRWAGVAALVALVGFAPLIVNELTTGFSETRAVLGFVAAGPGGDGGSGEGGAGIVLRLVVGAWRALATPISGVVTGRPLVALFVAVVVVGAFGWRGVAGVAAERAFVRWTGASIGWTLVGLAISVPALATIVPGLPTDHYLAMLQPLVLVGAALGVAGLWGANSIGGPRGTGRADGAGTGSTTAHRSPGRVAAVAALALAVLISALATPPTASPDGGWPLAEQAAARIRAIVGERPIRVIGLPPKSGDAIAFPLVRGGAVVEGVSGGEVEAAALVVVCDPLFAAVTGTCGGEAEDRLWVASGEVPPPLADRFEAGARRTVSVYLVPTAAAR